MPDKQAQVQAKAMRRVLDTALNEQVKAAHEASDRAVAELDTKTERAVLKLDSKLVALDSKLVALDSRLATLDSRLESELAMMRKEIAIARRDTLIWLGGMLVAGFGLVLRYIA